MAVERTYIDDENIEAALVKLSEYLTKTAVPKYFSKIENTDGIVSCYTTDGFLMMTIEYPLNNAGITIYTRNDTSVNIKSGSTSYTRLGYAYQSSNGISLRINQSGSSDHPSALTITEDESGNTAVVSTDNLRLFSPDSVVSVYIINENSDKIIPLNISRYDSSDFAKTVLVPLVVLGSSGNYTPNAFLQLFGHNTEQGTLEIEGVKYFSNGLWCVRDE